MSNNPFINDGIIFDRLTVHRHLAEIRDRCDAKVGEFGNEWPEEAITFLKDISDYVEDVIGEAADGSQADISFFGASPRQTQEKGEACCGNDEQRDSE